MTKARQEAIMYLPHKVSDLVQMCDTLIIVLSLLEFVGERPFASKVELVEEHRVLVRQRL